MRDSIAIGEHGPTHQLVKTVYSLRMMPDPTVMRPADGKTNKRCHHHTHRSRPLDPHLHMHLDLHLHLYCHLSLHLNLHLHIALHHLHHHHISKRGSGPASTINPCLQKLTQSRNYYDICQKHCLTQFSYSSYCYPPDNYVTGTMGVHTAVNDLLPAEVPAFLRSTVNGRGAESAYSAFVDSG